MQLEVLDQDAFLYLLAGTQLTEYLGQDCVKRVGVPFLPHQKMQDGLFLSFVVSERFQEYLGCESLVGV